MDEVCSLIVGVALGRFFCGNSVLSLWLVGAGMAGRMGNGGLLVEGCILLNFAAPFRVMQWVLRWLFAYRQKYVVHYK